MTFFNSNFFVGLATLVTGCAAYLVYSNQKSDFKVQAARVLLTEIRTAETRIEEIRDKITSGETTDLPSVFPTKSWKTYSHLFVSDFDQDELKLINSFYDYAESIEDFAIRNNNFFWVNTEERAKLTLQKLAGIIDEAYPTLDENYIVQKRNFLNDMLNKYNLPYVPVKTSSAIQNYLAKIQMVTTSSCGTKLKKLAKLN